MEMLPPALQQQITQLLGAEPEHDEVAAGEPSQLLYTVQEAAELLAVGQTTVKKLIRTGELQSCRIGSARRIRRADIERFIEELK